MLLTQTQAAIIERDKRGYILRRGEPGCGVIQVPGCKNDFTNLSSIAWLASGGMVFRRVPGVTDAEAVLDTFRSAGAVVIESSDCVKVDASKLSSSRIDQKVRQFRASTHHLAALAARTGYASAPAPGGDPLGKRGYEFPRRVLAAAGAEVDETDERLSIRFEKGKPRPFKVSLLGHQGHRSIGGSMTALVVAATTEGTSALEFLSESPIVTRCMDLLRWLGVEIDVDAAGTCFVTGSRTLANDEIDLDIAPDIAAAATYLLAGVSGTPGRVHLAGISADDFPEPFREYLQASGVEMDDRRGARKGLCATRCSNPGRHSRLITDPSTTDLGPMMLAYAALHRGGLSLVETVHISRSSVAPAMEHLGIEVHVTEGPTAIEVSGAQRPRARTGTTLTVEDIRQVGALMVLASQLEGEVTLSDPKGHLYRGYEQVRDRMAQVGVSISDLTVERSAREL